MQQRIRPSRRALMRILPAAALAWGGLGAARAQESVLLAESDAEALALGYKADATTVDKQKYPAYAPGQRCDNCQLYAPDGNKPTGGCGLFYGKDVAAKGWCSAWAKQA